MKSRAGAGRDDERSKEIVAEFIANLRLAAKSPEAAKRMNQALSRAARIDDRPRNPAREYARSHPYQEREGRSRTLMSDQQTKAQRLREAIESGLLRPQNSERLLEDIYRAERGDPEAQKRVASYLKNEATEAVFDAFC